MPTITEIGAVSGGGPGGAPSSVHAYPSWSMAVQQAAAQSFMTYPSDTASRIGRRSSSTLGSASARELGLSSRARTASMKPSRSKASVKTRWTWVEVSCAETIVASHLRLTRSSMTVAATPARVKCAVS